MEYRKSVAGYPLPIWWRPLPFQRLFTHGENNIEVIVIDSLQGVTLYIMEALMHNTPDSFTRFKAGFC